MLGVWLEEQQLSIKDNLEKPIPKQNEALIQLLQAGICNTDIELCNGYYPYCGVLGHEFVGLVIQCNDKPSLIGQRVCGDINASCGTCQRCTGSGRIQLEQQLLQELQEEICTYPLNNVNVDSNKESSTSATSTIVEPYMPSHCANRTVLGIVNHNGCFANYLCLPYNNLYIVPDNVTNDEATFVEPLAAALEIQEQLQNPRTISYPASIQSHTRIIIIGDGKLGQLVAQSLKVTTNCSHIHVIGKHQDKLNNLHSLGIVTSIIDTNDSNDSTNTNTNNNIQYGTYDIAIECTGNKDGFNIALQSLRPRGIIILKSTYANNTLEINTSTIVINEITIIGSRCGPFDKAIQLLANPKYKKQLTITNLIHGRYPLQDGIQAFEHAKTKGTMKIILYNNDI